MAIRHDHDDGDGVLRRHGRHSGDVGDRPPPQLGNTLLELTITVAGFAGVVLLVYAVLGAPR
jgi:hypothetical protein